MTSDPTIQNLEFEAWKAAQARRVVRTRRILATSLVVLAILLLVAFVGLLQIFQPVGTVASQTQAGGIQWVRSIYGWGRTADQQLADLVGVGVASDGTIWATDQGRHRVVGFNPDGSSAGMLYQGVPGDPKHPNALQFPTAVAVGGDGRIYVCDQYTNRVLVMTKSNQVLGRISVPSPTAVAVHGDTLVVGSNYGFVIMSADGNVKKVVGTQGKGDKQFMGVRGVAIGSDGTIYAVDQYNNRVSAYDANGNRKWMRVTGNPGNQQTLQKSTAPDATKGLAGMQLPAEITIDGAGRLVIVDPFGFNLVVLNAKDGSLIGAYGDSGSTDGLFLYPSGVSYDAGHDWFAVADTMNARVELVRLPGSGGSALAPISRTLSGPLRALLFPLALLFLALCASLVYRSIRRNRERAAAHSADQAIDAGRAALES